MTENTQFKTLVNAWLIEKKPMITPSTHANFVLISENHLIPYFGRKKIGSITETDIQEFISYLYNNGRLDDTGGLTVKSIRDVILVLRLSLNYAYKERIIPLLNWDLIEYPKDTSIKKVISLSKEGDSDPINEISGTNGIAGCADALFVLKKSNRTQGNATLFCTGRDIEDREIELAFSKEDFTWKMTADSAENPNMLLPDEMNLLIEMMKAEKYFNGSNAEFLERYNAFSGKNLSARILKRMMNKWKYDLNDNHVYFKSYKENNIRKVEVNYDCENDN